MTISSIEPVTSTGWYQNTDGTVSRYYWAGGSVKRGETVATWADVPSDEERLKGPTLAEDIAAGRYGQVP